MKKIYLIILSVFVLVSCKKDKQKQISLWNNRISEASLIQENENMIKTRFKVPKSFKRIVPDPNTFENYLQRFKLKPIDSKVHLYNGELKSRQDVHESVLDISVGKRDLQQCADATMRLRAEFLYQQKRYKDIHFKFTNGFNVAYSKWREGYRLNIKGNHVSWFKTNKESASYKSFSKYMQYIFMYAGTLSLEKELNTISLDKMNIGDIFIQGGSPGHAVIVVDMAINSDNEFLFMLAQSYMPAQEIHILKNLNNSSLSPWYSAKNLKSLQTPEWNFSKDDLKKF